VGQDQDAEEPLAGGRDTAGVVRVGGTVRRPASPASPVVRALLRHLAAAGFAEAPRVLGVDARGRDVLGFIAGAVAADPAWRPGLPAYWPDWLRAEGLLGAHGDLVRRLHAAAAGFRTDFAGWRAFRGRQAPGQIVGHGDLGPWNTVYARGRPVGVIDWDHVRPIEPMVDFGLAAWAYTPLGDDRFPDAPRRLRRFCAAYGVTDPETVLDAVQQGRLLLTERIRFWGHPPARAARSLEGEIGELRWLAAHRDALAAALAAPGG
jgi:Ser/Thr protein kinase RdoA (MazF antagonist)